MEDRDFDPAAPLPGPPVPWASSDMPSRRDGPPFHMTEMIAAEPAVVERILGRLAADPATTALAGTIGETIRAGRPVIVTGCGTSEHGALAMAEIVREVTGSACVWSAQAFELSLDPPSAGALVVGISHEGATGATNAALSASRAAGSRTALVTVTSRSPGAAMADIVVETGELDQSWCHTVGYVSPIAAATAVAGHITGAPVAPGVAADVLRAGLTDEAVAGAEGVAGAFAGMDRLLVLGSGADRPAARELVLKVEEGAWLPAAYRDLETMLHGHLAATGTTTGILVIATDRRGIDRRMVRVRGALAAARVIGMPAAAIVSRRADAALPPDLTTAGRIVLADASPDLPASVSALLGTATALQTVTERLARARGVDPDPIHRDVDRYRDAADAADAADAIG